MEGWRFFTSYYFKIASYPSFSSPFLGSNCKQQLVSYGKHRWFLMPVLVRWTMLPRLSVACVHPIILPCFSWEVLQCHCSERSIEIDHHTQPCPLYVTASIRTKPCMLFGVLEHHKLHLSLYTTRSSYRCIRHCHGCCILPVTNSNSNRTDDSWSLKSARRTRARCSNAAGL